MRNNPTKAELILWNELKNKKLKLKFRRQHIINKFIVDFYNIKYGIIIEVDGKIHNNQIEEDKDREDILKSLGCNIIRFTNDEVLHNTESVITKLKKFIINYSN